MTAGMTASQSLPPECDTLADVALWRDARLVLKASDTEAGRHAGSPPTPVLQTTECPDEDLSLHTPPHSRGSACFHIKRCANCGDGNQSFTAEIQLEVEGFVGRDSDGVQLRSLKSRLRVELDVLRQKKILLDNGFKPAKFTGYSQSFLL